MGDEKSNANENTNQMNTKDFMIGTLVGALLGAAAALLLSPKSGAELRADLAEGYQNASKKTQKVAKNVGEQSEYLITKVKETVDSIKNDIQEWRADTQEGLETVQPDKQNMEEYPKDRE